MAEATAVETPAKFKAEVNLRMSALQAASLVVVLRHVTGRDGSLATPLDEIYKAFRRGSKELFDAVPWHFRAGLLEQDEASLLFLDDSERKVREALESAGFDTEE